MALPLLTEAMDGFISLYGVNDARSLRCMFSVASAQSNSGDCERGQALCVKVLRARRRLFGDKHPDTLIAAGMMPGCAARVQCLETIILDSDDYTSQQYY